ncbi:hypothetical protein TNCV_26831 [Trichonephila clavipes]|uniref:Uncharacterized protein n=1 Tax=Trichonephila clavipes TaxID=2585209 RepID=A0A8X7BMA8_TRICX|nr:hypothetical protein TNCV_26831 [Trichonephila clavipes]
MGFHEFSTGTPAREPPSFSARFSLMFLKVQEFRFHFHLAAPAREDCVLLENDWILHPASLTVRCPQRYFHGYQRRI